MRLSDMQRKDIIFLKDGKKIGRIVDAEIEIGSGRLKNLLVEKKSIKGMLNIESDVRIKFEQIKKIGEDVILIDVLE